MGTADAATLYAAPRHPPYTRALLSAVPGIVATVPDGPGAGRTVPDPAGDSSG